MENNADTREERSKYGDVRTLALYDRNVEDIAMVSLKAVEEADGCISSANGRWFAGVRLEATAWDGVTKYIEDESDQEMNDRLNQWQHFLERDEEDAPVRRDEAKSYLEQHNILQLFNDLTSSPVYHRPAHPRKFMIEQIEKIRLARERSFYKPLQLKKKNANAIYDTLDPIDRGSITVSQ